MSIENKLTYLNGTKDAIKQAIIGKGVSVTEADTFRSYASKIEEIQGGGTPSKYTGHADAEGLKAIGWTDEDIQYYQENGVNWNEEYDEYHKVPQENIDLYGVLNENNIQDYKDLIVYLPKIEVTKTSLKSFFSSCKVMVSIPFIDTSNVTDMSSMFSNCYSLTTIPQLNTSNVTDMSNMFYGCYSLTTIPQLNTSKVTMMGGMFYGCNSLTTIPQLNTSKVTNVNNMFSNCNSLTTIPQLDTSKVTYMYEMFSNCYSLTTIPQLNTSKVTDMVSMFYCCYSLTTIPQLNTSNVTDMEIFYGNYSLQNIKIDNLKSSIKLNETALLSKESLLYIIQNATPTSRTTITLHSNVFDKYIRDGDIASALSAQPKITLEK